MSGIGIFFLILLGIVIYIVLTFIAMLITSNRHDDTPVWEVIILCILFTPFTAIALEMLKPYRVKE